MFDRCVSPILTYGSEVWGLYTHESIENVQIRFCKKILGVGSKTPTNAVLGDCGRFHMFIMCSLKCLKYWLKILELPQESLAKGCYDMLYSLDNVGKANWVTKVKNILFLYGFGEVWLNQGVRNVELFVNEFKQRLLDCEIQYWASKIIEMPKLRYYNRFKTLYEAEQYLFLNVPRKLKAALAKFRMSSHNLEVECGRKSNVIMEDRLCKACGHINLVNVECEYHVVMNCYLYDDVRQKYIGRYIGNRSLYQFINLMGSQNDHMLVSLAIFIHNMFKIRQIFLSSL